MEVGGGESIRKKGGGSLYMACMTQQRGSGTEEGEKIMKGFSLVPLDVKHGSPSNFDVLSGRCRNVGSIRDIGLVDALGGLNNQIGRAHV